MALKTNYKDDIFSGNRKYTQIDNGDGTISFTDSTQYSQVGDTFGATQINEIDGKINTHDSNISTINSNIGTINSNINTINSNINSLNSELTVGGTKFYFDYQGGKWGWNSSSARGAGTFHPFRVTSAPVCLAYITNDGTYGNTSGTVYSEGYFIFNGFGYIDNSESRPTETLTVGGLTYTISSNSNRNAGFRVISGINVGTPYSLSVNWSGPTNIRWQYFAALYFVTE